jgi:hypothetical protein
VPANGDCGMVKRKQRTRRGSVHAGRSVQHAKTWRRLVFEVNTTALLSIAYADYL